MDYFHIIIPVFGLLVLGLVFFFLIVRFIRHPEYRSSILLTDSWTMRILGRIVLFALLVTALFKLITGIGKWSDFATRGIPVRAEIINVDHGNVDVAFVTGTGEKTELNLKQSETGSLYEKGDHVEILYIPGSPPNAVIDHLLNLGYGPLVFFLFFIVFAEAAVLFELAIYSKNTSGENDGKGSGKIPAH